jgi:hypothetical protein
MNVEIGTEAVQFPEKEYINGIILAVNRPWNIIRRQHLEVSWRSAINSLLKLMVSGQEQLFIG